MATDAPHTVVYVPMERDCDIHPGVVAYADAKIPGMGWGWVCRSCFDAMECSLGLGKGQRLVVGEPPASVRTAEDEMRALVADALGVTEDEIDL